MRLIWKKELDFPLRDPRTVNFHGIDLEVDGRIKLIAADASGLIYGFKNMPITKKVTWWPQDQFEGVYQLLCKVDLQGMCWKDTLIEVEQKN